MTSETSKRLDPLSIAVLAIPDESMDVSVGDPEVHTLLIGTGEAVGIHPDGALPVGFSPLARGVLAQG